VRPDAGALCCVRLRPDVFDTAAVTEFYRQARLNQIQLASGSWFGEDNRVFRLGFGYLSKPDFKQALAKLSQTIDAVFSYE
jgi:DNA-binding transcriptional MocR family regulator